MIAVVRTPVSIIIGADSDEDLVPILEAVEEYNATVYLRAVQLYESVQDTGRAIAEHSVSFAHFSNAHGPSHVACRVVAGEDRCLFVERLVERVEQGKESGS